MRKFCMIFLTLMSINAYADHFNFYAYFINNSTHLNIDIVQADGTYKWDNYGWDPCSILSWDPITIQPNDGKVICAGSTNNTFAGAYSYKISVYDPNTGVSKFIDVEAAKLEDGNAPYLSIPYIPLNFGGFNDSDAVFIYIINDSGISITAIQAAKFNDYINHINEHHITLNSNNICSGYNDGCATYIPF